VTPGKVIQDRRREYVPRHFKIEDKFESVHVQTDASFRGISTYNAERHRKPAELVERVLVEVGFAFHVLTPGGLHTHCTYYDRDARCAIRVKKETSSPSMTLGLHALRLSVLLQFIERALVDFEVGTREEHENDLIQGVGMPL